MAGVRFWRICTLWIPLAVSASDDNLDVVQRLHSATSKPAPVEPAPERPDLPEEDAYVPFSRQKGAGMNHRYNVLPQYNTLICTCAKCGSTSIFEFVYKELFGHAWPFEAEPWVQETWNGAWEGRIKTFAAGAITAKDFRQMSSVAYVRDPKERIVSSWMSKVTCECKDWGCDFDDRARLVPDLLRLAGKTAAEAHATECLEFYDFLVTLEQVFSNAKAAELEAHFLPQQYGCFADFPREKWSNVTFIGSPGAATVLAEFLGSAKRQRISPTEFPKSHLSPSAGQKLWISQKEGLLLDRITAAEYAALGITQTNFKVDEWIESRNYMT